MFSLVYKRAVFALTLLVALSVNYAMAYEDKEEFKNVTLENSVWVARDESGLIAESLFFVNSNTVISTTTVLSPKAEEPAGSDQSTAVSNEEAKGPFGVTSNRVQQPLLEQSDSKDVASFGTYERRFYPGGKDVPSEFRVEIQLIAGGSVTGKSLLVSKDAKRLTQLGDGVPNLNFVRFSE